MSDTTSISFTFFGKITNRKSAIELAKWASHAFFSTATMLVMFFLLATIYSLVAAGIYLSASLVYLACGYFTRFKLSRAAAVAGVFFSVCCFPFSGLLPGGNSGLVFAFSIWLGIRGIEATFKLHGRFLDSKRLGSD